MEYNNIQKALQEKYSTNITSVYIPSLKKSCDFKSITVGEQKTITKVLIEADENEYKIYQLMMGMIKNNCLDDDFDISTLLEIDRIKIIIELYRSNFFLDDITIECVKCGDMVVIKNDMDTVVDLLNDIDITPQVVNVGDLIFTIQYPSVVRMSDYYENKQNDKSTDGVSDLELYEVFISKLEFDTEVVDFNTMTNIDRTNLLNILPQDILFGDDGLITIIDDKIINIFKTMTDIHVCPKCGNEISGGASVQDFFI